MIITSVKLQHWFANGHPPKFETIKQIRCVRSTLYVTSWRFNILPLKLFSSREISHFLKRNLSTYIGYRISLLPTSRSCVFNNKRTIPGLTSLILWGFCLYFKNTRTQRLKDKLFCRWQDLNIQLIRLFNMYTKLKDYARMRIK